MIIILGRHPEAGRLWFMQKCLFKAAIYWIHIHQMVSLSSHNCIHLHYQALSAMFCTEFQVQSTRMFAHWWLLHIQDGHLECGMCLLWNHVVSKVLLLNTNNSMPCETNLTLALMDELKQNVLLFWILNACIPEVGESNLSVCFMNILTAFGHFSPAMSSRNLRKTCLNDIIEKWKMFVIYWLKYTVCNELRWSRNLSDFLQIKHITQSDKQINNTQQLSPGFTVSFIFFNFIDPLSLHLTFIMHF